MTPRWLVLGTIFAALFQTAALGKLVWDRASALQSGREVVLKSTGFEPRDMFRGHYVRIRLDISDFDLDGVTVNGKIGYNDPVWVELLPGDDGFAMPTAIHDQQPETSNPVLQGTASFTSGGSVKKARIRFPFSRYYAEKSRALDLDDMNRKGDLGVILSVQPDGTGLIKGLTLDGQKIYEEPLY